MEQIKIYPSTRSFLYALKAFYFQSKQDHWSEYNRLKKLKADWLQYAKQRQAEYRNDKSDFEIADYSRSAYDRVHQLDSMMESVKASAVADENSYDALKEFLATALVEFGTTRDGRQYKILVVDDNEYVRELLDIIQDKKNVLERFKINFEK